MIFFSVLALTAFLISIVAGYFSITGLATIFPAATISVMVMGAALELGKLVTASWLYRFWHRSSKLFRGYLVTAVLILSGITSLGIFGFLSKAHIDGEAARSVTQIEVETIDASIQQTQKSLFSIQQRIDNMDRTLTTLSGSVSGIRRISTIQRTQAQERRSLDSLSLQYQAVLDSLTQRKAVLYGTEKRQEAELGPLVFMADLLYDDRNSTDKAVRLLILTIMVVFDPLAILLVVAANIQWETLKRRDPANIDTSFDLDTWFHVVDDPLTNKPPDTRLQK